MEQEDTPAVSVIEPIADPEEQKPHWVDKPRTYFLRYGHRYFFHVNAFFGTHFLPRVIMRGLPAGMRHERNAIIGTPEESGAFLINAQVGESRTSFILYIFDKDLYEEKQVEEESEEVFGSPVHLEPESLEQVDLTEEAPEPLAQPHLFHEINPFEPESEAFESVTPSKPPSTPSSPSGFSISSGLGSLPSTVAIPESPPRKDLRELLATPTEEEKPTPFPPEEKKMPIDKYVEGNTRFTRVTKEALPCNLFDIPYSEALIQKLMDPLGKKKNLPDAEKRRKWMIFKAHAAGVTIEQFEAKKDAEGKETKEAKGKYLTAENDFLTASRIQKKRDIIKLEVQVGVLSGMYDLSNKEMESLDSRIDGWVEQINPQQPLSLLCGWFNSGPMRDMLVKPMRDKSFVAKFMQNVCVAQEYAVKKALRMLLYQVNKEEDIAWWTVLCDYRALDDLDFNSERAASIRDRILVGRYFQYFSDDATFTKNFAYLSSHHQQSRFRFKNLLVNFLQFFEMELIYYDWDNVFEEINEDSVEFSGDWKQQTIKLIQARVYVASLWRLRQWARLRRPHYSIGEDFNSGSPLESEMAAGWSRLRHEGTKGGYITKAQMKVLEKDTIDEDPLKFVPTAAELREAKTTVPTRYLLPLGQDRMLRWMDKGRKPDISIAPPIRPPHSAPPPSSSPEPPPAVPPPQPPSQPPLVQPPDVSIMPTPQVPVIEPLPEAREEPDIAMEPPSESEESAPDIPEPEFKTIEAKIPYEITPAFLGWMEGTLYARTLERFKNKRLKFRKLKKAEEERLQAETSIVLNEFRATMVENAPFETGRLAGLLTAVLYHTQHFGEIPLSFSSLLSEFRKWIEFQTGVGKIAREIVTKAFSLYVVAKRPQGMLTEFEKELITAAAFRQKTLRFRLFWKHAPEEQALQNVYIGAKDKLYRHYLKWIATYAINLLREKPGTSFEAALEEVQANSSEVHDARVIMQEMLDTLLEKLSKKIEKLREKIRTKTWMSKNPLKKHREMIIWVQEKLVKIVEAEWNHNPEWAVFRNIPRKLVSPPVVSPPVVNPPVVSPPVASPPVASPPVVPPTENIPAVIASPPSPTSSVVSSSSSSIPSSPASKPPSPPHPSSLLDLLAPHIENEAESEVLPPKKKPRWGPKPPEEPVPSTESKLPELKEPAPDVGTPEYKEAYAKMTEYLRKRTLEMYAYLELKHPYTFTFGQDATIKRAITTTTSNRILLELNQAIEKTYDFKKANPESKMPMPAALRTLFPGESEILI